ncbi:MAG: LysM peptidoglycan-binding domain-containing protein [Candidatus Aureabacteria bacterium]|nr:LysM peptidoglycan-binding domain-containing protein [Candidatus Auribacterota bacterium]
MNRRNLILAVVAAHVCVFTLAALFGGCAREKKGVALSTSAPVKDIRAPEAEPESILEPKGMVEEADVLVAREPEAIPKTPVAAPVGMEKEEMKPEAAAELKEKEISTTLNKKEKGMESTGVRKEAEVKTTLEKREAAVESAAEPETKSRGPIVPAVRKAGVAAPYAEKRGAEGTHKVTPGESLWKLSQKYGVSRAELAQANNLKPDSSLRVGQVLVIPGGAVQAKAQSKETVKEGASPQTGTQKKHVVRKGESLSSIARHYKVSLKKIIEANGITDPRKIRAGQTLLIP